MLFVLAVIGEEAPRDYYNLHRKMASFGGYEVTFVRVEGNSCLAGFDTIFHLPLSCTKRLHDGLNRFRAHGTDRDDRERTRFAGRLFVLYFLAPFVGFTWF